MMPSTAAWTCVRGHLAADVDLDPRLVFRQHRHEHGRRDRVAQRRMPRVGDDADDLDAAGGPRTLNRIVWPIGGWPPRCLATNASLTIADCRGSRPIQSKSRPAADGDAHRPEVAVADAIQHDTIVRRLAAADRERHECRCRIQMATTRRSPTSCTPGKPRSRSRMRSVTGTRSRLATVLRLKSGTATTTLRRSKPRSCDVIEMKLRTSRLPPRISTNASATWKATSACAIAEAAAAADQPARALPHRVERIDARRPPRGTDAEDRPR